MSDMVFCSRKYRTHLVFFSVHVFKNVKYNVLTNYILKWQYYKFISNYKMYILNLFYIPLQIVSQNYDVFRQSF